MVFVLVWLVGLALFVTLRVWTTRPSAAAGARGRAARRRPVPANPGRVQVRPPRSTPDALKQLARR